jgi:hypothetical protein
LEQVPGLRDLAEKYFPGAVGEKTLPAMELILHGLASISRLSSTQTDGSLQFADLIGSMLGSRHSGDESENT